jgi:Lipopolysaccharide kinase (Kdo/WaaP) family
LRADSTEFHVAGAYQPLMRLVGLDAEAVFSHSDIQVWRKLPDRENCRLDAELPEGKRARLHIKRYFAIASAMREVEGHRLLESAGIATAPLVGWGRVAGRGSFVIFDDLTGYAPGDKLLEMGTRFDVLLTPTAQLAAKLHSAGLHHRDLYLCHFMAKVDVDQAELKLIDTARVKRLPGWFSRRWVVKDLAQFWYSTLKHAITDSQRRQWLAEYDRHRGLQGDNRLTRAIERKVKSIARHDIRLHRKRPERDVSIPA